MSIWVSIGTRVRRKELSEKLLGSPEWQQSHLPAFWWRYCDSGLHERRWGRGTGARWKLKTLFKKGWVFISSGSHHLLRWSLRLLTLDFVRKKSGSWDDFTRNKCLKLKGGGPKTESPIAIPLYFRVKFVPPNTASSALMECKVIEFCYHSIPLWH